MTKMIKLSLCQNTPEWFAFRKGKIGASMIPAICGVSPYQTRNQLLKEFVTGETKAVNDYTQKIFADGHEYEEIVRDKINDSFKIAESRQSKFIPAVVQYQKDSLFFASLDGLDEEIEQVLEIKTTSSADIVDQVKSAICPVHYNAQIQWQLFITGYNVAALAVLDKRDEALYTMNVYRDDTAIEGIIMEVSRFRKEVESSKQLATVTSDDLELKYIAESKKVVSEYQKLIDAEEEKIKELSEQLLKKYNANCIIGHNVKIEFSERKGAINYGEIEALREIDLEAYRKPSSRFVKITVQKQKQIEGNDNERITSDTK